MLGTPIFPVEVTNLTKFGLWLMLDDEELYLDYENFPWFKGASAEKVFEVERPSIDHLYWSALDIDLSVRSIREPSAFPLMSMPVAVSAQ